MLFFIPFIEIDDNFDAPEVMDNDNAVDDYNDGDVDDGIVVAKEVEVKWSKIIYLILINDISPFVHIAQQLL